MAREMRITLKSFAFSFFFLALEPISTVGVDWRGQVYFDCNRTQRNAM